MKIYCKELVVSTAPKWNNSSLAHCLIDELIHLMQIVDIPQTETQKHRTVKITTLAEVIIKIKKTVKLQVFEWHKDTIV